MQFDILRTLVWESELKAPKSPDEIAKKHGITPEEAQKLIDAGAKVEKEHTMDLNTAKIISSHHVYELVDYYSRLKKVEKDK